MNYEPNHRHFGWLSRPAIVAIAILFLPMAPGVVDTGPAVARAGDRPAPAADAPYPQIVKTVPEVGATDVSPHLGEVTVTFDRDMSGGMSWTGGPPLFPPSTKRAGRWSDARTCVLPVKLAKGSYYRLGINSTSFQNFKSTNGTPAPVGQLFRYAGSVAGRRRPRPPPGSGEPQPEKRRRRCRPQNQVLAREVQHADGQRHVVDRQRARVFRNFATDKSRSGRPTA